MATRRPLVAINGQLSELPTGDVIAGAPLLAKMNYSGSLSPTTGSARFYPDRAITLSKVYFSLGGASLASVTIDVKKNGTSILGGTLPSCASGSFKSNEIAVTTTLSTTDYLTVDIVSAIDGKDLVAFIAYS